MLRVLTNTLKGVWSIIAGLAIVTQCGWGCFFYFIYRRCMEWQVRMMATSYARKPKSPSELIKLRKYMLCRNKDQNAL